MRAVLVASVLASRASFRRPAGVESIDDALAVAPCLACPCTLVPRLRCAVVIDLLGEALRRNEDSNDEQRHRAGERRPAVRAAMTF